MAREKGPVLLKGRKAYFRLDLLILLKLRLYSNITLNSWRLFSILFLLSYRRIWLLCHLSTLEVRF